jgi:flagellar hook-associated protein 3 FlgL
MTRISQAGVQRFILRHLSRGGDRLSSLRLDIASGIRIRTPSDDVLGTARALAASAATHRAEGFSRASDSLLLMFDGMEASLKGMTGLLGDARAIALQAANDFGDEQDGRAVLAEQIDHLLEQALDTANLRTAGRYVFGGMTPGEEAFVASRDGDGRIVSVASSAGSAERLTRFIGDEAVTLSVTGPRAYGGAADVFAELAALREAILDGDLTAIQAGAEGLAASEEQVSRAVGSIGALRARHLEAGDRLEADELRHETERSRVMDTDIAEAMVLLQAEEASYEAALQITVRLADLSLMKYL